MTTTSVILIISPSLNTDGSNAHSTRGQLFYGKVDGRPIVMRSTTPFCDAARALLADDVDPATVLVMRHAGANYDALRSTVGTAAGMTVKNREDGKPRFAKWRPNDFHGGRNDPQSQPVRETKWETTMNRKPEKPGANKGPVATKKSGLRAGLHERFSRSVFSSDRWHGGLERRHEFVNPLPALLPALPVSR